MQKEPAVRRLPKFCCKNEVPVSAVPLPVDVPQRLQTKKVKDQNMKQFGRLVLNWESMI